MDFNSLSPHGQVLVNSFKSRLPLRLELDCLMKRLPRKRLQEKVLLDIGMPNPVMSAVLREHGGAWATLARSPAHAEEASEFLGTPVVCLGADGEIPYDPHAFDVVVVSLGMLSAMSDPTAFLKECNRVLKSAGELIVCTQFKKSFSLINLVRRLVQREGGAIIGEAYTERTLFGFLKYGFDVISTDSFSRFFVELVRIYESRQLLKGVGEDQVCEKARWLYRLADQLDFFTLWSRGFVVVVHARRRQWRERTAPVLADGRTIREAVLTHG
ncbi:MAG: class I SAM-dependent methyltransferase [Kiritimatiellia bacterium]|jgi:SAM-dependent methyltransferase